ncbi:hypothetical protein NDU88_005323 [Pleurodeles waltl]|uniref:Uncharacterized protein n=1 Tax=Pleurodeles waltl TaxID=8319 RepID=A0AAV7LKT7_PLEWA|nr:hypothetical protein NDU88_005323 [Pleurodeles waltl]
MPSTALPGPVAQLSPLLAPVELTQLSPFPAPVELPKNSELSKKNVVEHLAESHPTPCNYEFLNNSNEIDTPKAEHSRQINNVTNSPANLNNATTVTNGTPPAQLSRGKKKQLRKLNGKHDKIRRATRQAVTIEAFFHMVKQELPGEQMTAANTNISEPASRVFFRDHRAMSTQGTFTSAQSTLSPGAESPTEIFSLP